MRIRSWTACMAVVAIASGAGAASASAATTTFDVPVSGAVFNDCTAEWVAVTGTQHFKFTNNSSLSGIKSEMESNLIGVKGTGLVTGARYVMNDQTSDMQHAEFDPFGDAQLTMENTTILNRQSETGALLTGDDFRLYVIAHLTVTNGVTKSDKTDLRAECR
jgi:hypothetical protein